MVVSEIPKTVAGNTAVEMDRNSSNHWQTPSGIRFAAWMAAVVVAVVKDAYAVSLHGAIATEYWGNS